MRDKRLFRCILTSTTAHDQHHQGRPFNSRSMGEVLPPREAAKYIAERSKNVTICTSEMKKAAQTIHGMMLKADYSKETWKKHDLHPKVMNEETLNWIFVVDCLNFSFWQPKGKPLFKVKYNDQEYEDYEALCAVVNRALKVRILFLAHVDSGKEG